MQLSFEKEELLYTLQMVQGIAGGPNTLPILSNVLIRAQDGNIECAATDLEVGIRIKVIGTISEEGSITVSAKKLADIVRELPDKPIELVTTANNRVELTCGDGVYKIIGMSDEDFPEIPAANSEGVVIEGETLCSVIHKTQFAASTDDVRYTFNGLYFNLTGDKTEVVATDGTRQLALTYCTSLKTSDEVDGFIVPLKAIREVSRIFTDSPEVRISHLKNQLLFSDDNTALTTRLVEGEYPPYQKLFRDASDGRTVVSKDAILRTTRRVSLLSDPKNSLICLEIDAEQIKVSAKTPELGEAHETLPVESSTGNVRIGLDARVLTDVLTHIETDSLIFEFTGEFIPLIVKPTGDNEHTCFIMPMRLEPASPLES
ncbi:MAG: DNA polymerase III subunit beta [Candidatus Poribacteria bacterium]|nr:DNA polymerase III subunit beta [Candidatus Poribacteria bacterium]